MSDELVIGRLVPASGGSGVCDRCGGVLDARESGLCVCFSGLRASEPRVSESKLITDSQIHDAFIKYRYGYTPYIDRDSFMLAVKELLRGDK